MPIDPDISRNVVAHDAIALSYDSTHPEIFNHVEQRRLLRLLVWAVAQRRCPNDLALDLGAGTGNLTGKLLSAGMRVVAADVSKRILGTLRQKFRSAGGVVPNQISGELPLPYSDESFGFVGCFSVLHHVPDYLAFVREMVRVAAPGGIVFIDHEVSRSYWQQTRRLSFSLAFERCASPIRHLGHPGGLLKALGCKRPFRTVAKTDYPPSDEGDIHTHPGDHIEWPAVINELSAIELLKHESYLLCRHPGSHLLAIHPLLQLLCRGQGDMEYVVARRRI